MGRQKLIDRPIEKTISIPTSVLLPWEVLLTDNLTHRVKHGAFSRLVTRLLREELARMQQAGSQYFNRRTGEPTTPDPLDPED